MAPVQIARFIVIAFGLLLTACVQTAPPITDSPASFNGSPDKSLLVMRAHHEDQYFNNFRYGVGLLFLRVDPIEAKNKSVINRELSHLWMPEIDGTGVYVVRPGIYLLDLMHVSTYTKLGFPDSNKNARKIMKEIQEGKEPDLSKYHGVFEIKAGEVLNLGSMKLHLDTDFPLPRVQQWFIDVSPAKDEARKALEEQFGPDGIKELPQIQHNKLNMPEKAVFGL